MKAFRWWRWLALLIAVVGWWGSWPEAVHAAGRHGCGTEKIKKPCVVAEIQFSHHHQTFVQAHAITTIKVPMTWHLADSLTLGEESDTYRRAMRRLLRQRRAFSPSRAYEWRLHRPRVTANKHSVTVHYEAFSWINHFGKSWLGPWLISVHEGNDVWRVTLPPEARSKTLNNAHWERIEIRMGGLSARDSHPKASAATQDSRVWTDRSRADVSIGLTPPWHASFALKSADQPFWSRLGIGLWWVCGSAMFALAVLSTRPRSSSRPAVSGRHEEWPRQLVRRFGRGSKEGALQCTRPRLPVAPQPSGRYARWSRWWSPRMGSHSQGRPAPTALLWWAGLSAGLGLTLALLIPDLRSFTVWQTVIGIAASLALIIGARPWRPIASAPIASADAPQSDARAAVRHSRAWGRTVIVASSAAAAMGLLVVLAPRLVHLPGDLAPPDAGVAGQMLLALVLLWLWLAAMAAWAWRFAREGELIPRAWGETWDRAPVRCLGAVGAALGLISVIMLLSHWRATELSWQRATWLSDHDNTYHSKHDKFLRDALASFGPTGLRWAYAHTWVLTDIALVALLNARAKAAQKQADRHPEQVSLGPSQNDMRLTSLVFAIVVATRQSLFAGSSLLFVVWLVLNIAALYAVRAVGRRWSVLSQAGGEFLIRALGTAQGRSDMLEKAHEYRNLHSQLRLVDQGHAEKGTTRELLEDRLRRLRHWRPAGCDRDCLPDQLSVVDVALSWGPYDSWWDNARHAARLAFVFGIPASAAIVWAAYLKGAKQFMQTNASPTGLPEVVARFLTWQIAWAGAGLILGALWRMLPGRRGPARALCLTIAYAIPIGVGAVVNRITDTELGNAILSASLMLIVLTLTSISMDAATFSGERQLWPTRFSLLLSIYQMRALSVQIAYLLAQLVAAIGIWRFLAGGALAPH
ncbi:DUF6185 family protein [Streptomyces sp. ME19-01-6]|uniref:DUF6185 family protein n=1 Tax=Streptomyces sp. ME19-01-6 TaxID=3028686 RepID=UPI0029ACA110|nr:DUF6185 family protein [Streptomyces sp. ME19-01-6]MDX3226362.1 DUF6185 family protein [Streptomyces sp. ME19-01-6]